MSTIGSKSGNSGAKASTTSSSSSAKKTEKASSISKPKQESGAKATGDRSTLSGEKGKAGSMPNLAASFGTKPAATMRAGSKGDDVKALQEALNAKGAKLDTDGKYGAKTAQAVKDFQEKMHIKSDGIAGKDTMGKLQGQEADATKVADPAAKADPTATVDPAAKPGTGLDLPQGYESLEKLSGELGKRDPRFNTETPDGRSATALALAIGGTEQYGKDTKATDFFTSKGGTGSNMLGFGQFNQKYHAGKTNTPEKYTQFMGDILTGDARMPNSKAGSDHAAALSEAVKSGKIKDGQDLRNFMTQRGFGGSNWQGIDDGWKRNPGLANALVDFLKQGG